MCGIAGILVFRNSDPTVSASYITKMCDTMTHRGPDGAGIWISHDKRIGLGHRRLSIIDLSTRGLQPMEARRGAWMVFNGEIYNYRELRAELKGKTVLAVLTGEGLKDPVTVRELTKGVRRKLGLDIGEVSRIGRTKLKILNAIREGYNYGYSIWRYLLSYGIDIKLPTIYQHLNELERLGLVKLKSRVGLTRQKAVYVLTKKGEELSRLFPD